MPGPQAPPATLIEPAGQSAIMAANNNSKLAWRPNRLSAWRPLFAHLVHVRRRRQIIGRQDNNNNSRTTGKTNRTNKTNNDKTAAQFALQINLSAPRINLSKPHVCSRRGDIARR